MARVFLVVTAAFVLTVGFRPTPEANAAMDFRQVIVNMLDGMNRQDMKTVMSYYADDAESRGTASCDCKGKAGIEKDNLETFEINAKFTVVSLREVQTGMGYGRVEMRSDVFGMCGVNRAYLNVQILIANEKIVKEIVDFDRADVDTAKLFACISGGA